MKTVTYNEIILDNHLEYASFLMKDADNAQELEDAFISLEVAANMLDYHTSLGPARNLEGIIKVFRYTIYGKPNEKLIFDSIYSNQKMFELFFISNKVGEDKILVDACLNISHFSRNILEEKIDIVPLIAIKKLSKFPYIAEYTTEFIGLNVGDVIYVDDDEKGEDVLRLSFELNNVAKMLKELTQLL